MFLTYAFAGFQFNDKRIFDVEVGKVFSENSSVFILDCEWILLLHLQSLFSESVGQGFFINFLEMATTMVFVNGKAGFPDSVAQLVNRHLISPFCALGVFCGRPVFRKKQYYMPNNSIYAT